MLHNEENKPRPGPAQLTRTICIIDHHTESVDALATMLADLDASIEVFADAETFLAQLDRGMAPPACLIVELLLPGLSGLELIDALNQRGIELPTVMVASDTRVSLAVRAMRAGVVDYFEKPFIEPRLRGLVSSLLDGRRELSGL